MSLEVAAKHLAAHGRHGDSTLVHMNHKEVAGLQALARSKGKSLTINPRTGLPEAFNLRQELSNVTSGIAAPALGAALVYFSGGVIDPVTAGYIVGGTNYVATGGKDPVRSVMGGLGAYGGGSVMGSVTAGGEAAVGAESVEGLQAEAAQQGLTGAQADAYVQDQVAQRMVNATPYDKLVAGASNFAANPSMAALGGKYAIGAAALPGVMDAARPKAVPTTAQKPQMIRPYKFDYNAQNPNNPLNASYVPGQDTSERKFFAPTMVPQTPYQAADGGIIALAGGGMPVEQMSNNAAMGANTMYPMANMATSSFATPYQAPQSTNMLANMVAPSGGGAVGAMSGEPSMQGTRMASGGMAAGGKPSDFTKVWETEITPAQASKYSYNPDTQAYTQAQAATPARTYGTAAVDTMTDAWNQLHPSAPISNPNAPQATSNYSYDPQSQQYTGPAPTSGYSFDPQTGQYSQRVMAAGGITDLGSYSDGGRLLRGPGDGVSDSIPAQIGNNQPARLADGEFVIPARIVSELGNGSTEAGAKQLYKMLDRVQQARSKTTGKNKVAKNTNAAKLLPA